MDGSVQGRLDLLQTSIRGREPLVICILCPVSSGEPEESAGWLELQLAGDVTRGQGCEYAKRQAVS